MPFKVNLTYFKRTGKYYSDGFYTSDLDSLNDIWMEVNKLVDSGSLPGLVKEKGRSEFIVSIDVPDHPNNHPRLII